MKLFFLILICKILHFLGRIFGRGSSLPGKIILKLDANILTKLKLPKNIIAVTGSNGKTSTCEMLAAVISDSGAKVIYNKEGSNQTEGITTLLLINSSLKGVVDADFIVLESDERYCRHTFKHFTPSHFIINNLYRDQLTRNGHPECTYNAILESIHPETTLILNADDPLVSLIAYNKENTAVYFGSEAKPKNYPSLYNDCYYCPNCKKVMTYSYINYNHIGHYECFHCSFKRQAPKYSITNIGLNNSYILLDNDIKINLTLRSLYNAYNILAVYSLCMEIGIDSKIICNTLNNYIIKNDRIKEFNIGEKSAVIYTSKHENSISYNNSIDMALSETTPCCVMIFVDEISRKYYTTETSWLWDIEFNRLIKNPNIQNIILCGDYYLDLAVRFNGIKNTVAFKDISDAKKFFIDSVAEKLIVITCFSDRDKVMKL